MDGLGDDLLPRAALSDQKYGVVRLCRLFRQLDIGIILADDIFKGIPRLVEALNAFVQLRDILLLLLYRLDQIPQGQDVADHDDGPHNLSPVPIGHHI